jgi:PAS domain S-box-containing protein
MLSSRRDEAPAGLNRPERPCSGMETVPRKILLVEDSAGDARLLVALLDGIPNTEFQPSVCVRVGDAVQRLAQERFHVILSDLSLPDSQGLETFRSLHAAAPDIPILVLSGNDDEDLALNAVREGAQDYLVKGRLDGHILSRAIRYAMERHRIEQALHESERHYKHLLESITDYAYTVKLENGQPGQVEHSRSCEAVTGYKPEDYNADPYLWYRMVHEDDRAAVSQQVARVCAGETPPPLEHRIIHRQGDVIWVRSTVVPGRDEAGQLVGYDGLISDITERKRAEERLVESKGLYQALVENLPQNIFRKNLNEQFTFANQRFCTLLGRPLDEIIGKTDFDFYPPELARKYQRDDRMVIETGKIFETVEENIDPNGEKIYVHVVKTPIHGERGQTIGTQCIFWDVTESKRYEERLQKAYMELSSSEAALRRSHEELKAAQLQLIQAEKMESIGTLAAGVAHEVKNPLAIILMGLNYLTRKVPATDENTTMVLREMKEAVERANTITRGLLDFAKARQVAFKAVDMNALVRDTIKLVRHEIDAKNIQLELDLASKLPAVSAEPNQIQQVLVNILMNSIHALSKDGRIKVHTYTKSLTETTHLEGSRKADRFWVGDTAIVTVVEDNGHGIPEENLTKIFDPFFTTKPTGIGTGLGLAVSRKIIDLHGGTLDVRNRPEGGVRVTIMLKEHRN